MFYKIDVFIKFCKIHRKNLVTNSLLNVVKGVYPATLLKTNLRCKYFLGDFCKILKNVS